MGHFDCEQKISRITGGENREIRLEGALTHEEGKASLGKPKTIPLGQIIIGNIAKMQRQKFENYILKMVENIWDVGNNFGKAEDKD